MYLRHLWYFACPAKTVGSKRPVKLELLGEPILLARDGAGRVFALRDLCPHRGVPLSAGRLCPKGAAVDGKVLSDVEVECPYHGWRFAADGHCTAIPSLCADQKMDVEKIRVRRYPVVERQGCIWIYMGEPGGQNGHASALKCEAPVLPGVPENAKPGMILHRDFDCFVDHAVIGLMDPAHGPFVHRSWFWRSRKSIHEKSKRFGPSEMGFAMLRHPPSKNSAFYKILGSDLSTEICFRLPGIRTEVIETRRGAVLGLTCVTPVNETTTRVTQCFFWTVPGLSLLALLARPFAGAFLDQDRCMVDLQKQGLKYDPRLMLIQDADRQAMWYFQLRKAWEDAAASGRAFVNPVEETTLRWRS